MLAAFSISVSVPCPPIFYHLHGYYLLHQNLMIFSGQPILQTYSALLCFNNTGIGITHLKLQLVGLWNFWGQLWSSYWQMPLIKVTLNNIQHQFWRRRNILPLRVVCQIDFDKENLGTIRNTENQYWKIEKVSSNILLHPAHSDLCRQNLELIEQKDFDQPSRLGTGRGIQGRKWGCHPLCRSTVVVAVHI